MERSKYYEQFLEACETANIPFLSDEFCCQLLAAVYVYGSEDMIFNEHMNLEIRQAQKRLNAVGGGIPNSKLIPTLQRYVRELEDSKDNPGAGQKQKLPDWALKLQERYHTSFRR